MSVIGYKGFDKMLNRNFNTARFLIKLHINLTV